MKSPKKSLNKAAQRTKVIAHIILLGLTLITFYTGYLQLIKGEYFLGKSKKNFLRQEKIFPSRGTIFDCNGIPIAITKPIVRCSWKLNPKKLSAEDEEILNFLKETLNFDIQKIISNQDSKEEYIILCHGLSFDALSMILENFPDNKRIILETNKKRAYPFGSHACHIVGYLHKINKNGVTGIESMFDEQLTGEPGVNEYVINAQGKIIETKEVSDCIDGEDLHLTVNIKTQKLLESILPESIKGAGIVLDAQTGAIRALTSSPRFDPKIFQENLLHEEWQDIIKKNTLLNRCTMGTYPPASLFKIIVATAMLEEKIANEQTTWFCRGEFEYKGRKYHCHNKRGHGKVDLKEAVAHSCNIPFFWAAINGLSIDIINKYTDIFELGKKTGSLLNEKPGLIPSRSWKKQTTNERWYTGETLSVAIGQGATLVTPLQMARTMAAYVTGHLSTPRIHEKEEIVIKPIQISATTRSFIRDALLKTSDDGLAKLLKNIKNWEIGAKTGTAQLREIIHSKDKKSSTEDLPEHIKHHGWLACFGKYKNQPPIVLVLMMENVGSSQALIWRAREFFKRYEAEVLSF